MCGISGFFGQKKINLDLYYEAHTSIGHRGPDDEGFILNKGKKVTFAFGNSTNPFSRNSRFICDYGQTELCLGHHRLSILDLSHNGHQPFQSSCKRYFIVYNGEIYNYIELRRELKELGCSFKTNTDVEVFLAAFSQWKEECFSRLNGMWAAVIYDSQRDLIYFSRDRFGIKPLYYCIDKEGTVYFASEIKFFRHFGLAGDLNRAAASNYLHYNRLDYNDETFFTNIHSFSPSHYGIINSKGEMLEKKRYWDVNPERYSTFSREEAEEKLYELFTSSLELRMRSDVPVGALLSGGLDSTAIVCLLAKNFNLPNDKIKTFSAIFQEKKYSEEGYIRETARLYPKIDPYYVSPSPFKLMEDFPKLLETIETPFRSLSAYSQFCLYQYIKNETDIKVLLNGQGADELFAGYRYHYTVYFTELLRRGKILGFLGEVLNTSLRLNREVIPLLKYTGKELAPKWIKELFKKILKYPQEETCAITLKDSQKINHKWHKLNDKLYKELTTFSLPEYLRYEDRNSMAFSLEARLPFLDYRIVEFAFSLQSSYKINNGINKKILRDAVKGEITPSVLSRKDKMGFVSPQEAWQKRELKSWMSDVILTKEGSDMFKQDILEKNFFMYQKSQKTVEEAYFWWRVFCFKYWVQLFLKT